MALHGKLNTATRVLDVPLVVEAIVFDMDGTLLDTEPLYREAFMEAAASLGLHIPPQVYECVVGVATPERGPILRHFLGNDFPWDRLRDAYYLAKTERAREGIRVKPGAASLLRHVEKVNLGKGIATSASRATAEAYLRAAGLREYFDIVVTRDDVSRGKPYPEIFTTAARRIGVASRLCLALEDSEPGISAAWLAGMLPVMVTDTMAPNETIRAKSVRIVSDLKEVRTLLGG